MEEIVDKIEKIWKENKAYDKIKNWIDEIESKDVYSHDFNESNGLMVYRPQSESNFNIRYLGVNVAKLSVKNKNVKIKLVEEGCKKFNFEKEKYFKGWVDWKNSNNAKMFRKHFKKMNPIEEIEKRERAVESLFLTEMYKKGKKDKFCGTFSGIQPVSLCGFPLQIPLPISANTGEPKGTRGNIDILARVKGGKLSIWELKAPGVYKNAIREAYIYAITLAKIFRTKEIGKRWYNFCKIKGEVPKKLKIDIVIAITEKAENSFNTELKNFEEKIITNVPQLGLKLQLWLAIYEVIDGKKIKLKISKKL